MNLLIFIAFLILSQPAEAIFIPYNSQSKALLDEGLKLQNHQGHIIRILHGRPEKIYLITAVKDTYLIDRIFIKGLVFGWCRRNFLSKDYTIMVDIHNNNFWPPQYRHKELFNTFAHEASHALVSIAGVKLKSELDEEVADILAGIPANNTLKALETVQLVRERLKF